jgi:hypothetical protein
MRDGAMPSYVTRYASGSNAARVGVEPRDYSGFKRVATLRDETAHPREDAELVLVDPSGEHIIVQRYQNTVDAVDRSGAIERGFMFGGFPRNRPFLTGKEIIYAPLYCKWGERPEPDQGMYAGYQSVIRDPDDEVLALRLIGNRWINVGQMQVSNENFDERVTIYSGEVGAPAHDGERAWQQKVHGQGVAAIADDGRVLVSMRSGQMLIFAAEGKAHFEPIRLVDVQLDQPAHFISASGADAVLLSLQGVDPPYRRRGEPPPPTPSAKATLARGLDAHGVITWSTEVPFEALQPAVDGGGGRVYVVGRGIAALERGVVQWAAGSESPLQATAFADGTLAVVVGSRLRIVDRSGGIRQDLTVPDGGLILTPPAIGPDGAVWIATKEALYVAR